MAEAPAPLTPAHKKHSQRFWSGNILLISVLLHVLFAVAAGIWVVSSYVIKRQTKFTGPPPTPNPSPRVLQHRVNSAKKQGGGGAMVGADALMRQGLKIANYADTSGNPTASKVYRVIKLIFSQPNIAGYILMGPVIANQEQWHHAHAIVKALREELVHRPNFPVIILLAGNKDKESLEILKFGLKGLPAKIEIYGRDYVDRVDVVAARMKELVNEYQPITEVM